MPADAKHFNGIWYRVYLDKDVTWRAARDKCARAGGRLACVLDEPTHIFIRDLADGLTLWLGATDSQVEGKWEWVDGSPMKFKAWNRGEPNNWRGKEHYIVMAGRGWSDGAEKNNWPVVGYICEWPAK